MNPTQVREKIADQILLLNRLLLILVENKEGKISDSEAIELMRIQCADK